LPRDGDAWDEDNAVACLCSYLRGSELSMVQHPRYVLFVVLVMLFVTLLLVSSSLAGDKDAGKKWKKRGRAAASPALLA
jgi:hypothetical protein